MNFFSNDHDLYLVLGVCWPKLSSAPAQSLLADLREQRLGLGWCSGGSGETALKGEECDSVGFRLQSFGTFFSCL